jgi:hypothetical protein
MTRTSWKDGICVLCLLGCVGLTLWLMYQMQTRTPPPLTPPRATLSTERLMAQDPSRPVASIPGPDASLPDPETSLPDEEPGEDDPTLDPILDLPIDLPLPTPVPDDGFSGELALRQTLMSNTVRSTVLIGEIRALRAALDRQAQTMDTLIELLETREGLR